MNRFGANGVTDQDVAVACVMSRVICVISCCHQRAYRLGINHPLRNAGARRDGAGKEAAEILGSGPEEGSSADHTDAHDLIGQWDHPEPSMLEQVHGDHPLVTAILAGHIAKVSEHGSRVVALVYPFRPEASTRKRENQTEGSPLEPTAITFERPSVPNSTSVTRVPSITVAPRRRLLSSNSLSNSARLTW